MKVRAIVIHQFGDPAEVARCEEITLGLPDRKQAHVRVLFAPINPADINMIQGAYAVRPDLPAVPGGEGIGVVEAVSAEVHDLEPGTRVLFPAGLGSWRERLVADADQLIPVPADIPVEQAAMLRVNPATAFRMLHDFVDLQPGEWLIQNASNSGVGRAVIQIAAARGWRTVNLVRRAELVEELRGIGADAVVVESGSAVEEIAKVTDGAPIRLALNAVGGESALRLAEALAPGGTHVTYGAMSRQPVRIPNGLLIFKDLRIRGFWVTRWYHEASRDARDAMLGELFALARDGRLHTPIERMFPLEDAQTALKRAMEGGRAGKVLFKVG